MKVTIHEEMEKKALTLADIPLGAEFNFSNHPGVPCIRVAKGYITKTHWTYVELENLSWHEVENVEKSVAPAPLTFADVGIGQAFRFACDMPGPESICIRMENNSYRRASCIKGIVCTCGNTDAVRAVYDLELIARRVK